MGFGPRPVSSRQVDTATRVLHHRWVARRPWPRSCPTRGSPRKTGRLTFPALTVRGPTPTTRLMNIRTFTASQKPCSTEAVTAQAKGLPLGSRARRRPLRTRRYLRWRLEATCRAYRCVRYILLSGIDRLGLPFLLRAPTNVAHLDVPPPRAAQPTRRPRPRRRHRRAAARLHRVASLAKRGCSAPPRARSTRITCRPTWTSSCSASTDADPQQRPAVLPGARTRCRPRPGALPPPGQQPAAEARAAHPTRPARPPAQHRPPPSKPAMANSLTDRVRSEE
jgi:hypothetical protein